MAGSSPPFENFTLVYVIPTLRYVHTAHTILHVLNAFRRHHMRLVVTQIKKKKL
jgi:hypothetical protein